MSETDTAPPGTPEPDAGETAIHEPPLLKQVRRWMAAKMREAPDTLLGHLRVRHLATHRPGNPSAGKCKLCAALHVADQIQMAAAGRDAAPHVEYLADAAAEFQALLSLDLEGTVVGDFWRAALVYEQTQLAECDRMEAAVPPKALRRRRERWATAFMDNMNLVREARLLVRHLHGLLGHLASVVRGQYDSAILHAPRRPHGKLASLIVVEKLFHDAGLSWADVGELLYDDRKQGEKIRQRVSKAKKKGLPTGVQYAPSVYLDAKHAEST
jgi:hypothetical protein